MTRPLGWWQSGDTSEGFVSVLVIRHPNHISAEGAGHQCDQIAEWARAENCEVVGSAFGIGKAQDEAEKIVRAVWSRA